MRQLIETGGRLGMGGCAGHVPGDGTIVPLPAREVTRDELAKFAAPREGLSAEVNAWREQNIGAIKHAYGALEVALNMSPRPGAIYGRLALGVLRLDPDTAKELNGRLRVYADPETAALGKLFAKRFGDDILEHQIRELIKRLEDHGELPRWSPMLVRAFSRYEFFGIACYKLVTDAGVDFIVDAFQNTTELENLKYHGIGTGSTAEASTETALVTELTTQYNPDNTRATGSTIEGASTNIYRTVGTNAVDAGVSLREHGILDQAATGGGTLLDRSLYALITLSSGDSLQSTYDFTVNSGG